MNNFLYITKPNQIFVFGSNRSGIHGAGAALYAKQHYGAIDGIGEGFSGPKCYALPTKGYYIETLSLDFIKNHSVRNFLKVAEERPELEFLLSEIGTGLAGFKKTDIAPLFQYAPLNVTMTNDFIEIIRNL